MWLLDHYPKTCTFVLFVIVLTVAVPTAVMVRYITYLRLAYRQYIHKTMDTTTNASTLSSPDEEENNCDDSDEEGLPPSPPKEAGGHTKHE